MQNQRRLLLAMALAAALLLLSEIDTTSTYSASLRSHHSINQRQESSSGNRQLLNFRGFKRELQTTNDDSSTSTSDEADALRKNCQIVYVLGVEGVGHHGFSPIFKRLIEHQLDPHTGLQYKWENPDDPVVQKAIYGRKAGKNPKLNDPELIMEMLRKVCPNDGHKHVLALDTSFPSKAFNDGYYPVSRQKDWADRSMHQIANSYEALHHPLNLREFYKAYEGLVDVKFVALSSPFVETVARHMGHDGGPEGHAAVLSGYLLLIKRFLDELDRHSKVGNSKGDYRKLWTIICMEQLSENFHLSDVATTMSARHEAIYNLATFLGWPTDRCDDCFDEWRESDRTASVERRLSARGRTEGKPNLLEIVNMKVEVMRDDGIWPPVPNVEGQKQCTI